MTPLGPFQPSECLSPAVGRLWLVLPASRAEGRLSPVVDFPLFCVPHSSFSPKQAVAGVLGLRLVHVPPGSPWRSPRSCWGSLAPCPRSQTATWYGDVVRGFEALEAKKVRTDFYLISSSIGKACCLRDGDSFTCLTFEGLEGCMSYHKSFCNTLLF